ncbi:cache domain-containing protein [Methanomicrobium antiquum]|uniref:Cache domain-containing protein n=1 Tax=Methanomicrobium antiquum TaxID=487686 RepID=A0AAF0FYH4_9EURY|nr:cache domain-containing protein [Methanomicrobium antiquum]WFN36934.1 cache domain-containing protein [Methanomicrobium antiquum]
MKKFNFMAVLSAVFILAVFAVFSGCTGQDLSMDVSDSKTKNAVEDDMKAVSEEISSSINKGLIDLRSGILNNSKTLTETGLTGDVAEKALLKNLLNFPWAFSSLVISDEGVVLTAVPKNYAETVGMNLSWQKEVLTANEKKTPIVSDVFEMAEGFTGISQSAPVFSPSGRYVGYTDITYSPYEFILRQVKPAVGKKPYDVWVSQADGTLIYDTKEEEVGNNLLTDEIYNNSTLQSVLKRILSEETGVCEYTFSDRDWKEEVSKTAVWTTAGIDGAEWRVVVTYSGLEETAEQTAVAEDISERFENLKSFVQNAARHAKESEKGSAVMDFNDREGSFVDGELYIFAYEYDGTVIALPFQKELLRTKRFGITDSNGVKFIDASAEIAKSGGGSLYYVYQNPSHRYKEEFKIAYVLPAGDDWYLGAGIYMPEFPCSFNDTEKDELVKRVKAARDYALENGVEKATADFNDLNMSFADGKNYIFAYDYSGKTLALPHQPELIGENRYDFEDTYGVKIIQWEISEAKSGGGFVYVEYLNPDTGKNALKLCYVEPVGDEWLVGSGIYSESL